MEKAMGGATLINRNGHANWLPDSLLMEKICNDGK